MLDYKTINEKLNKIKNKYEYDVARFKKFSTIGNIYYDYQNINFEFELNKNKNLESNNNHTNQSIKKLLKINTSL
jgi:hypothetical protein